MTTIIVWKMEKLMNEKKQKTCRPINKGSDLKNFSDNILNI